MKPFILILVLFLPGFLFAQKTEWTGIKGNVTTADGQPAAFISVQVKNTKTGALTDENGNFKLEKLKPGKYILLFSLSGNIEKEIAIEVKQDEQPDLQIQIQHTYLELQKVIVESKLSSKYIETKPSSSLRLNYPLNEIPQNIQVSSRQLLSDQGLVSMSEAVRTVSGVQKNYGGLNDISLNIRGFDATYNVSRNGLGGYWWNQQEDIAMVEKIEFIKGPAGFILNDLLPGGFVNIVTKQPVNDPIVTVNITTGSYDLYRAAADIGGAISKKSNLSYRFNTGLQQQSKFFKYSTASRFFICGALKYEPGKKNTIMAEYNYMRGKSAGNNYELPSINGRLFALPRNFAVTDDRTEKLIVADHYYRLEAKHQFNDNWKLSLLLGYMKGKWGQGYLLHTDGSVPVINDTLYRIASFDDWRNFSKIAQLYVNGIFHTSNTTEHKVLAALDYNSLGVYDSWGEGRYFGLYIPNPNYYVNPDSLRNFPIDNHDTFHLKKISFFAEDHIKIKNKFIVTLAGRFSHEKIKYTTTDTTNIPLYQHFTFYNHFTPRLGLTWLFAHDISAYILYDHYFFPLFAKNFEHKQFKPLTGYNIETGIKTYFFEKKLSLNFSIHHIVADHNLLADPQHPGYYIQTGQVTSNGIELDATGNITPALMVNVNYSFTDAKVTKGDSDLQGRKNIGTPDHSCNAWINYRLLSGKLKGISFSLGYQYMGKRSALGYGDPGKGNYYLPVYHLLDAAINYRNDKFTVALNLYNLTNINYAANGYFNYSNNEWWYTPGEPVNFRLSAGINLAAFMKKM